MMGTLDTVDAHTAILRIIDGFKDLFNAVTIEGARSHDCNCGGHCHGHTDTDAPSRTCEVCGESFAPNTSREKYCSEKCAVKASRARQKARESAKSASVSAPSVADEESAAPTEKRAQKPKWTPAPMTCKHCGATFMPREAHQRYCSRKCKKDFENAQRPSKVHEPKACAKCGKTFTPTRAYQKFCSRYCQEHKDDGDKSPRKCKQCGEVFTPTRSFMQFCSAKCRSDFNNKSRGGVEVTPRPCAICGKTFTPATALAAKAKYCSDDCRKAAARRDRARFDAAHGTTHAKRKQIFYRGPLDLEPIKVKSIPVAPPKPEPPRHTCEWCELAAPEGERYCSERCKCKAEGREYVDPNAPKAVRPRVEIRGHVPMGCVRSSVGYPQIVTDAKPASAATYKIGGAK